MAKKKVNIFKQVDDWSENIIEQIESSSVSSWYINATSGLDNKVKNYLSIVLGYVFCFSPVVIVLILLIINSSVQKKNNLYLNLVKKIEYLESVERQFKSATQSFTSSTKFKSASSAKSFLITKLRRHNILDKMIKVSDLNSESKNGLTKISLKVSFSKLGHKEFSKLLETFENKLKSNILNLSTLVDKKTKLVSGSVNLEVFTK